MVNNTLLHVTSDSSQRTQGSIIHQLPAKLHMKSAISLHYNLNKSYLLNNTDYQYNRERLTKSGYNLFYGLPKIVCS